MTNFDWLEPWHAIDDEMVAATLARQLSIEASRHHRLFGKRVHLLARRADTDDVLFALDDGRVAEVHLTWRQTAEPDPRWPATAIFDSLEKWREESMRPLHAELIDQR